MASYAGSNASPLAALIAMNNPWAKAASQARGNIYKNGAEFEGVDEATADDFFSKLGTHAPYGAKQPLPFAPGTRLNGGEYVVTEGDSSQPGWGNFDPSTSTDKYQKIGQSGQSLIWKRTASAAADPAPQADPEPAYQVDQAKIDEALGRASEARKKYAGLIPSLDTTQDPYSSAASYGRQMQDALMARNEAFGARASAQTAEISEAGKNALGRFFGKVADYEVPDWTKYKA